MSWREANWASHVDYANRVFAMQQITLGNWAPRYLIFNWSHLADHADFTIYATAFFYLINHSIPWIMYLQAVFLLVAEIFLIATVEEYFGYRFPENDSGKIAAVLAALYATNPLILFAVLDDPHLHMFGMVAGLAVVARGMLRQTLVLVTIGSLLILVSGDLASAYVGAAIIGFLSVRQSRWFPGITVLFITILFSLTIQGLLSPVGSNFLLHYGHSVSYTHLRAHET